MAELNQDNAELSVFTFKEGLLSPVAHDLKLRVGRWSARLDKSGPGTVTVTGAFDASSLSVEGVMRDGRLVKDVLGARDTDKIAKNIRDEVLMSARHPSIAWRGQGALVNGAPRLEGELTLVGKTRRLTARIKKEGLAPADPVWVVELTVHQPDFGIKPYSAMLGALKIKPDVVVSLRVADSLIASLIA
jgi:polyisoprenoid-binding protein YceI